MKKKKILSTLIFPIISAFIWGTAFTAQSLSAEYVPPFLMNGIRSVFAGIVLLIPCLFLRKKKDLGQISEIVKDSIFCGILLFSAINFQQIGIAGGTDSGKAGFITAFYSALMPVIGLFVHKKVGIQIWISILIAIVGLYFLCISGDFTIQGSDVYVIVCAVCFAFHMYGLNYCTQTVHPLALSSGQFTVAGILSLMVSLVTEDVASANITACIPELIYMGLFSSCIAYTLQTISLRDGNPSVVSLLFCLESVFAVLAGVVVLNESLTGREIWGCVLMLIGVVLSQLPDSIFIRKKPTLEE